MRNHEFQEEIIENHRRNRKGFEELDKAVLNALKNGPTVSRMIWAENVLELA
jgi:hypothetical protein